MASALGLGIRSGELLCTAAYRIKAWASLLANVFEFCSLGVFAFGALLLLYDTPRSSSADYEHSGGI
jgi:hypothetical protein